MATQLFGVDTDDLPDGWSPVEAIAVVRCVDLSQDEGGPAASKLAVRATHNLTIWEALGMLTAACADLKAQYVDNLEDI